MHVLLAVREYYLTKLHTLLIPKVGPKPECRLECSMGHLVFLYNYK